MDYHFSSISGWLYLDEGILLGKYAKNKVCLEVGRHNGRSTAAIAQFAKKVVSIDIDPKSSQRTEKNLGPFKFRDKVIMFTGDSREVLTNLLWGFKFDFAFIDGDHSYEGVKSDIECTLPLLNENAIIAFHDYGKTDEFSGVIQAVDEAAKIEGWKKLELIGSSIVYET